MTAPTVPDHCCGLCPTAIDIHNDTEFIDCTCFDNPRCPNFEIRATPAETAHRIDELAELEPGWHFGDGDVIDTGTIRAARHLAELLARAEIDIPGIFPGVDGEMILFEWHIGTLSYGVEIHGWKSFTLSCIDVSELTEDEEETTEWIQRAAEYIAASHGTTAGTDFALVDDDDEDTDNKET